MLFTTGYARNAIVHGGRLDPGLQLINKPFTRAALAAKLREVLDAAAAPARVLLVEDDALIRMVAVEMLAEAGFQVEEAGNAGEALAKARTAGGRLAAAVVDFNLPDRPADGLAAELRAIRSDLPLVVASGYAEAELRPRFGDASRLAFVAKPYNASGLVEALRGLGVKVPGPRPAPS